MTDKEIFVSAEFFSNQLQSRYNSRSLYYLLYNYSLNRAKFYVWASGLWSLYRVFRSYRDSFYPPFIPYILLYLGRAEKMSFVKPGTSL